MMREQAEISNLIFKTQREQVALIHNIIRETKSMYQGHAAVIAELALEIDDIDLLLPKTQMLCLLQFNTRLISVVNALR